MAGKVNVPVTVAIQGLAKTQAQLGQLGKGISSVGKTAGLAAAGFAAFAGGIAIGNFIGQAIEGARDLERNYAGLKAVFENLTPRMKTFSESAVNMGLSMKDASKASVFIGSVLKQSGFSISETADLTERLVGLATDLSITYGYDVQEALMGMTALFRGEYDPIEKFGVAMKQSEINSELAARGMGNLEGAARRFAEQQIRVELLFQRSQDAQGAFARQSGTLAAEQLKLSASFDNVRDTVAKSLLPSIAGALIDLQGILDRVAPKMEAAFEKAGPVLDRLVDSVMPLIEDAIVILIDGFSKATEFVGELLDPTTSLGETLAGIAVGFENLIELVTTGLDQNPWIIELGSWLGETFLNAIHDIIYGLNEFLVVLGVLGEQWHAFVTGDWETLFNTDWTAQVNGALAVNDAIYNQELAVRQLNAELSETERQAYRNAKAVTAQAAGLSNSNLPKYIRDSLSGANAVSEDKGGGGGGEKKAKDYVKEFFSKITEEIKKQRARVQLEQMGASEGLIDSILGSQSWEKIWLQIKSGKKPLETLQKQFNQTAAGAKELADAAKASADALKAYEDAVAEIDAELTATLEDIKKRFDDVRITFSDLINGFSVLPTVARELGQFEAEASNFLQSLEDSLLSAFRNGDLLEEGYNNLRKYAQGELAVLAGIQRKRDELAQRVSLAESMINEYRQAFTASMSLTSLMDSLSGDVQKRTVTEVSKGVTQLGKDLRNFSVTVTRSYEETIDDVANKSQGLLNGFRDMATKARSFAENLRKLRDMKLDPRLFSQLVQAGVEAGGATAQALVEGGYDTVREISDLFAEVDTLGGELGFDVSKTFYDSGQKLIDQLLAGMRAEQDALETQAETMAEAFAKAFREKFGQAITAAQSAAETAARGVADTAKGELQVPPAAIDQEALATLKRLIERANQYIINLGGTNLSATAGAVVKRDLYQELFDLVNAGKKVDLTGIEAGLTSAELAQRAANAGANVTNITVNVSTDATQSNAMVGQTIANVINNYTNKGGALVAY
jgi:hypothetical protein